MDGKTSHRRILNQFRYKFNLKMTTVLPCLELKAHKILTKFLYDYLQMAKIKSIRLNACFKRIIKTQRSIRKFNQGFEDRLTILTEMTKREIVKMIN